MYINVHFNAVFTHLHQALRPFLHPHLICSEMPLAVLLTMVAITLSIDQPQFEGSGYTGLGIE